MFDVFDMMRRAQGTVAFDNLARMYGLAPEQMRAAAAAVSPAFAQAFQRRSEGELAAERLSQMLGAETYARAFDMQAAALDAAARGSGSGGGQGDAALAALFGSPDVSRAVAAQASAASGVQAEIIRKVLPVLASVLIGGMLKASRAQGQSPVEEYWRAMMGGASPFGPGSVPEEKPQPKEAATEPRPETAMGDMMTEMLNGMFPGMRSAPEEPAPPPPQETAPPPEDEDAHAASFDTFVEGSREWQAENAKAMEKIFDAFWGGAKKG